MKSCVRIMGLLFASVILMWGCSSPTDLDTPREKEFDPEEPIVPNPGVFAVKSADLTIEQTNSLIQTVPFNLQTLGNAEVEVTDDDVLLTLPGLQWEVPTQWANDAVLQALKLRVSKISVTNTNSQSIAGNPDLGAVGAAMLVRLPNVPGNITVYADGNGNVVQLTFSHDADKKEIQAQIVIGIFSQNIRETVTGDMVVKY